MNKKQARSCPRDANTRVSTHSVPAAVCWEGHWKGKKNTIGFMTQAAPPRLAARDVKLIRVDSSAEVVHRGGAKVPRHGRIALMSPPGTGGVKADYSIGSPRAPAGRRRAHRTRWQTRRGRGVSTDVDAAELIRRRRRQRLVLMLMLLNQERGVMKVMMARTAVVVLRVGRQLRS